MTDLWVGFGCDNSKNPVHRPKRLPTTGSGTRADGRTASAPLGGVRPPYGRRAASSAGGFLLFMRLGRSIWRMHPFPPPRFPPLLLWRRCRNLPSSGLMDSISTSCTHLRTWKSSLCCETPSMCYKHGCHSPNQLFAPTLPNDFEPHSI